MCAFVYKILMSRLQKVEICYAMQFCDIKFYLTVYRSVSMSAYSFDRFILSGL